MAEESGMGQLAANILGFGVLSVAITLAYSTQSPIQPSSADADVSSEFQVDSQPTDQVRVVPNEEPQKRAFSARQADHSMATRFRKNLKIEVTIRGQIHSPGPIHLPIERTLQEALSRAGGATEFGATNRVLLYRDGSSNSYDLSKPEFPNVIMEHGDIVEIPEKTTFGR